MSDLQAWIDKLGAMSTEDIRELMQQEGIKGLPCHAMACPIARFLRSKVDQDIRVSNYRIYAHEGIAYTWNTKTPQTVREFVSRFDNTVYPELVQDMRLDPHGVMND